MKLWSVFAILLVSFSAYGQKILIVATSADYRIDKPKDHSWGCYTPEVTSFLGVLYQSGFDLKNVDVVSPLGGPVPLAVDINFPKKFSIPDDLKAELIKKLKNSLAPGEVNANDYSGIYYSGGFSCLVDYPTSESIAAIASGIYERGGIIGAVCDGVSGITLIKLKSGKYLVEGRTVATNGGMTENALADRGAIISSGKTAVSDRLVTAKGVRAEYVAQEMMYLLKGSPLSK